MSSLSVVDWLAIGLAPSCAYEGFVSISDTAALSLITESRLTESAASAAKGVRLVSAGMTIKGAEARDREDMPGGFNKQL